MHVRLWGEGGTRLPLNSHCTRGPEQWNVRQSLPGSGESNRPSTRHCLCVGALLSYLCVDLDRFGAAS
ncbi:uncharacterized protein CCOS01_07269 [Colletotrichum costaricense]|uniref:Uncharacterized protein n=1 Tax=Colletotrichum costaricense TaxID=1209916 RepID=A0AAI9YW94_9PEZI|nr:uncharacterized protein CCOS01_07269 [Colletotrichum costaricense]KAK1527007.1 hypothetical protein CCOS01_07269 [Colletotrichum costaricense]